MTDDGTTRAIAWLTEWDSQGIHRTATAGDEAGANWLIREATGLGAAPAIEEFALDRLEPIDIYLEFDGRRVPGVPVFDAPATGPEGVSGILGRVGEQTPIALVELPITRKCSLRISSQPSIIPRSGGTARSRGRSSSPRHRHQRLPRPHLRPAQR